MKYTFKNLMPIKSFFIFLLYLLVACNKKDGITFDKVLIEKITYEYKNSPSNLPSKFSSIEFFGKCNSNKVAKIYLQDLKSVNKYKYPNLSFKEFLVKSLNQEILVDYQDKVTCFDLDKNVSNLYESNNFDTFLSLYTEKTSSNRLLIKKGIDGNKLNTVSYYLFLHNYLVSFDDYIGKSYVSSTSSYYENK